jgi:HEAT repeat protein
MICKKYKHRLIILASVITSLIAIFLSFYCNNLRFSNPRNKSVNRQEVQQEEEKDSIKVDIKENNVIIPQPTEKLNENKLINTLIEQLGSSDINKSMEAADKLASLGENAIEPLIKGLNGASLYLKGQIIFLLGRIKDKEATPVLTAALREDNAYVRRNATEALGKIRDERAIANLLVVLFDEDISVRQRAAWALGEMGNPQALEGLLDCMRDEKEEQVRSAVVDALGKIKDQRATTFLLSELASQAGLIYKDKVVVVLGVLKDPKAIPGLTKHIEELKEYTPDQEEYKFHLQQAIQLAEEAIRQINNATIAKE